MTFIYWLAVVFSYNTLILQFHIYPDLKVVIIAHNAGNDEVFDSVFTTKYVFVQTFEIWYAF